MIRQLLLFLLIALIGFSLLPAQQAGHLGEPHCTVDGPHSDTLVWAQFEAHVRGHESTVRTIEAWICLTHWREMNEVE
jgi:hypothetical protein